MYLVKKTKQTTAGIYMLFGGIAEDGLFVWNLPLGEKNLCICVQMKWKKGESWKPETIFRYLREVKSESFEHYAYKEPQ